MSPNLKIIPVSPKNTPLSSPLSGQPSPRDAALALNGGTNSRQHNSGSTGNQMSLDSLQWPLVPSRSSSLAPTNSPLFSPSIVASTCNTAINGRSITTIETHEMRLNVICNWLHQQQLQKMWSIAGEDEGVMIKKNKNEYICCPRDLSHRVGGLYDNVGQLNVKCAMTINTRTIQMMLDQNDSPFIPLVNGLRLQVIPDVTYLPRCQKSHRAAFIQEPPLLIAWDDDPSRLPDWVQELESQMMTIVWKDQMSITQRAVSPSTVRKQPYQSSYVIDIEATDLRPRELKLNQPLIVALTLVLICLALGAGWLSLTIEIKVSKNWLRLILVIIGPLQVWMGLFFMQTLATCAAEVFGPVSQMKANSKFYSGQPSPRLSRWDLPHVTVQCPVYKESLEAVIKPTMDSIRAAISTYELQGGTANIFVNDDGMQVMSHEEAQERIDFYDENCIGWVSRPRHNMKRSDGEKTFCRAGKFKKASNMNYALDVSVRVEDKLIARHHSTSDPDKLKRPAYEQALAEVIAEDGGRTWAAGDIRVGDYILLIDSDTRVPRDCMLDAVSELEQSPEVAILQFSSGVMNVTESWFEKGITFFTHLVYTAIEFAVANGDVAPFVGHNAFLRWTALQDVAYTSMADSSPTSRTKHHKFWSEDTVSEDFEMALRLQTSGYTTRLATYMNGGFKEGVSLTVYDELARWEKYAYGCSELIFHPFIKWPTRGPFTPLFRRFIFSRDGMPLHSKITIMAYVGTYFAIGSAWLLILLNYFLIGWYNGYLDHYYVDSFRIYFSMIIVFGGVGHVALAIFRYRTHERRLFAGLVENFKWVLLLTTFLGGISLHVSQAILCHLFSINMTWGATGKEVSSTSFFREIPVILAKFRFTFLFCFFLTGVMVVLSGLGPLNDLVPYHWQIRDLTAIFPLSVLVASHALLPLVLNPGLMQFTF